MLGLEWFLPKAWVPDKPPYMPHLVKNALISFGYKCLSSKLLVWLQARLHHLQIITSPAAGIVVGVFPKKEECITGTLRKDVFPLGQM